MAHLHQPRQQNHPGDEARAMRKAGKLVLLLAGVLAMGADPAPLRGPHDPSIIKCGDYFYVYGTHNFPAWRSRDLIAWENLGRLIERLPAWAQTEYSNARETWAPDVSYFNKTYHVYYAVSGFGTNDSAIGLMTNATLDPNDKTYKWVDQGKVVQSKRGDTFNAIDPNFIMDADGKGWLSYGSFWSGIKLRRVDPATGKLSKADTKQYDLAARAPDSGTTAIEAPFIIRHGDFYYLFVSWDLCCKGAASTYRIAVGRSKNVVGPYVDRDGREMTKGGGTIVLESYGNVRGPGHCAVLTEAGTDYLVNHYYDAAARGTPTLQIRPLVWDDAAWPLPGEPLTKPLNAKVAAAKPIYATWDVSVDFADPHTVTLAANGKIANDGGTWEGAGDKLTLTLKSPAKTVTAKCIVADDGTWFVGRGSAGQIVRGKRTDAPGS